jgi:hypothetical protein
MVVSGERVAMQISTGTPRKLLDRVSSPVAEISVAMVIRSASGLRSG